VFSAPEKQPVVKGSLLTTLPILTKGWRVSLEIFPTDYSYGGWTNILHLTIGGNMGQYGDRTPAIFFHPSYGMRISSAANGNKDHYIDITPSTINQWTALEVSQQLIGGKYVYSINIGGQQVHSTENTGAKEFSDVKVFASDTYFAAQPASIRGLKINNQVPGQYQTGK
jgi:hypothetical protein